MIPSFAIKRYLDRPLDSQIWIKKLKRKELLKIIRDLDPEPDFGDKDLYKHQLACFLLGIAFPQFAFWLDMGTGKTRLTLELIRYKWLCGELKRAIVFITSDKAYPTWAKQVKRFKIGLPIQHLEGSSKEKWRALEEFDEGIMFVSYPGAVAMVSARSKKRGKKKVRLRLDKRKVAQFADGVDALVMDESTRASGYKSLTHKMIKRMANTVETRYALAGRPFGRDPTLLWSQHMLVDNGESLGETLGLFRAAFFNAKQNYWSKSRFSKKFVFNKKMEPVLSRMIEHRSITYADHECIDVPKWTPMREEVRFPVEAQDYYDAAIKALIAAKGNHTEVKNVFLRMRQLSSGFIGYKNDDTGEKAQFEFEDNPKLDRLLELVDEMPSDRKGVVFYEFTHSGRKIAEAAKELGLNPIWIWSGNKNYARDLRRFEKSDRCRLAVVNNRIGAMALDGLQVANYTFFYESPVSSIDREQAERRLRRLGQKHKVFQYDLIVRGSVDAKILAYHKEAEDLMKAVLRNPRMLAGGKDGNSNRDGGLRGVQRGNKRAA